MGDDMKKKWEVKKWEVKKLGEVCSLLAGGDIPKGNFSKTKTTNLQVPVFSNGEKNNGLYGYTSIPRITESSITVSARGTIGFTAKRLEPFFPVVRLIVVTPNDSSSLSLDYLDYCLKTMNFKHSGTSIPQLTVPMIRDYNIPFPPITEQLRIVSILDKAFDAIDKAKQNAEQNLNNAKELFESYLQRVFEERGEGWEETTLGEIGTPRMCKRIFKNETSIDGDIPFYKIGTFGKKADAYITKELFEEYKRNYSYPNIGDVLISASGTIGRRVAFDGEPAYFQDSNIVWIDNDETKVLNTFLYCFYGYCKWETTSGATIKRLYNSNLKQIKISYPISQKLQQSVVQETDNFYSHTQSLESIYQQKLDDLEELKKSILEKAFSGEL